MMRGNALPAVEAGRGFSSGLACLSAGRGQDGGRVKVIVEVAHDMIGWMGSFAMRACPLRGQGDGGKEVDHLGFGGWSRKD